MAGQMRIGHVRNVNHLNALESRLADLADGVEHDSLDDAEELSSFLDT